MLSFINASVSPFYVSKLKREGFFGHIDEYSEGSGCRVKGQSDHSKKRSHANCVKRRQGKAYPGDRGMTGAANERKKGCNEMSELPFRSWAQVKVKNSCLPADKCNQLAANETEILIYECTGLESQGPSKRLVLSKDGIKVEQVMEKGMDLSSLYKALMVTPIMVTNQSNQTKQRHPNAANRGILKKKEIENSLERGSFPAKKSVRFAPNNLYRMI